MITETMDYFDLEKAFDTVPHEQLVAKPKTACSDCRIINWIINYLSGKKQSVVIRSEITVAQCVQWCSTGFRDWTNPFLNIHQ